MSSGCGDLRCDRPSPLVPLKGKCSSHLWCGHVASRCVCVPGLHAGGPHGEPAAVHEASLSGSVVLLPISAVLEWCWFFFFFGIGVY